MKKNIFLIIMLSVFSFATLSAQDEEASKPKSEVRQYIGAFESSLAQGKWQQAYEWGAKAAAYYDSHSLYKESFDMLRRIDSAIDSHIKATSERATYHYQVTKERYRMYTRFGKPERIKEQLGNLELMAGLSSSDSIKNDMLYTKTLYYYTHGQIEKGNQTFKEMATKLTAQKQYGKVDEVYQKLIESGRRSNSASLVAQSYKSYVAWKDSTDAIKHADEIKGLKKQIADSKATIDSQDSSLTARMATIIALSILAIALAVALVGGALVLMRFILLTRKQKKIIKLESDNNALKAKFISNISAQLNPTLNKLDARIPEVKALKDFSNHIQTLSLIESTKEEAVETEDTQIAQFCEGIMNQMKGTEKTGVTLTVNAPKMTANFNREYVTHILTHLLSNAIRYTPEGGRVTLDYKKRGAHTHQFIVTDSGCGITIPGGEEGVDNREEVFKAFRGVHDLTTGDGLGLPICKQMALKMKGDLTIDPAYTKGTRFILELHG